LGIKLNMAKVKIRRGGKRRALKRMGLRSLAAVGFTALFASVIVPLAGSQGIAARSGAVTVALDAPRAFNPGIDPALLLQASAVNAPAGATPAEIGAMVEASLAGPVDPAALPSVPLPLPALFNPGAPATATLFRSRSSGDNLRAQLCLTSAIYYEAANEPDEGQRAVAQVVLNRVRHPAWPSTVCDVVYQGTERPGVMCQFTFACDGAMARSPSLSGWIRARRVAQAALAGSVYAPVGNSTFYHTLAVSPSWGKSMTPTAIVGAHIFYRLPGGAGEARAFTGRYVGREPAAGPRAKLFVPEPPLVMAGMSAVPDVPLPVPTAWIDPALAPAPKTVATVASIAPTKRVAEDKRYVSGALPESDILPQYRGSGEWIRR
jgi:spore germination cell wall hydrolase CwlJ-like protein